MRYSHSSNRVYGRRQLLAGFAVLFVLAAVIAGNLLGPQTASALSNANINFQARLMNNSGAIVPDGFYNVEFKIYDALTSSGSSQGSCTGDVNCLWTENYYDTNGVTAGNDFRVRVANGYLTVSLGSRTAFPSTIKWDQQLWITMNIGGTTQTATPTYDGEMSPRLQLTAVPYAFRAGQLAKLAGSGTAVLDFAGSFGQDTLITLPDPGVSGVATVCYQGSTSCGFTTSTSGAFIQNGTTVQTAANFNIRSAAIGSVGAVVQGANGQTADLLQLQSWNGTVNTNLFTVGAAGAVTLAGGQTIDVTTANAATATAITIKPGTSSGASSNGPALVLKGGDGSGTTNVTGGAVTIQGGSATGGSGTRVGGSVGLDAGTGAAFANNGAVNIGLVNATTIQIGSTASLGANTQAINIGNLNTTGTQNVVIGTGTSATGGTTTVQAKGALSLIGGASVGVSTPDSTTVATSAITIQSGSATVGTNLAAGTVTVDTGTHTGSGAAIVNLGNTNAAAINIGGAASAATTIAGGNLAHTVAIAGGATNTIQTISLGSATSVASTLNILSGTGTATGDINVGDQTTAGKIIDIGSVDNAGTGTVRIATGAAVQTVTIGSTNSTSATSIQGGTTGLINIGSVGTSTLASATHIADTSNATAVQTVTIGSNANAGNLIDIDGGTGATGIEIGNTNTAHGIQIGSNATGDNDILIGGVNTGSTLQLEAGTATGSLAIGNGGTNHNIQIGTNATGNQVIIIGATANTSDVTTIQGGGVSTGGILLNATTVALNATNPTLTSSGANSLTVQTTGAGNLTLQTSSSSASIILKANNTSATALQIQSSSDTLLKADTVNNRIIIGNATAAAGADTTAFVFDQATTANQPWANGSGVLGAIFFDTTKGQLQCYEGASVALGTWGDCGSTTMQGAYNNTAALAPAQSILTTSTGKSVTIQTANSGGIAAGSELFGIHANAASDVLGASILSVNSAGVGINMGAASLTSAFSYDLTLGTGSTRTIGVQAPTTNVAGNGLTIQAATGGAGAAANAGGSLKLQGGAGGGTNGNGGTTFVYGGAKNGAGSDGNVVLAHNGTAAIGNVGIGTAAPTRTLHVATNNTSVATPMLLVDQTNAGGDAGIEFKNSATAESFYLGLNTGNNNSFSLNSYTAAASSPSTITHIQSTTTAPAGTLATLPLAYPSSTTAGNLLVAVVAWDLSASSTVSCSDNSGANVWSTAIIKLDPSPLPGQNDGFAICYAPNAVGGPVTVTATFGAPSSGRYMAIHEYSGVAAVNPLDVVAGNINAGATGTDAVTSTTANTTQGGDLILGATYNVSGNASTIAAGTGFTQRTFNATFIMTEDKVQSTPGSVAATNTYGTARRYISLMVAFKAATTVNDAFNGALFNVSQIGATTFKNSLDSSSAFQIQNAAGVNMLGLDTSASTLNLGVVGSTAATSTVNIGTSTGATQLINVGATSAGGAAAGTLVNIQGGTTANTAVTIGTSGAGGITVDTGTTGSILIGGGTSGNPAKTISIGPTATNTGTTTYNFGVNTAGSQLLRLGSTTTGNAAAGTLVNIQGGTTANTAITLGTNGAGGITIDSGTTGNINIGNGANSKTVTIGSTNGTSSTILQSGTGTVIAKVGTDSAAGFQVQNAFGATQLSLDTTNTTASLNLAQNGGGETGGSPPTGWSAQGGAAAPTQTTTAGLFASGAGGIAQATTATGHGVRNALGATALADSTTYVVSFSMKVSVALTNANTVVEYYRNNTPTLDATCSSFTQAAISTSSFIKYTCTFTTSSSGTPKATTNFLAIRQADGTARSLYIDNLSVVAQNASGTQDTGVLRVGGANSQGLTLLTLDSYASTPFTGTNSSLAGSMYFDTTQGKIQCYDGASWGACGAAPDSIVTLTPEYAGAVLNGTGIGTMTSDFCATSGALTVGTLCGSGDARNFYKWTSPQTGSLNEYDIYVTYKLPATFKTFSSDTTITLTARTDNTTNGIVTLEVYRAVTGGSPSISACGTETDITTAGGANVWSTLPGNGSETGCGFVAGNNVIFKIRAKAKSGANVYVENLNFTYSNQ